MLGRIKNSSIRSFDENNDFILFSYSIEHGTSIDSLIDNDFYEGSRQSNLNTVKDALKQISIYGKISEALKEKLYLLDLLDPLHIQHPTISGLFPGKKVIRDAVDIELNDAGIVLLLETWTRRVTKKRENITHFVHTMIKKREKMGAVNKISLEGIQPIQTIFWLYAVLILGAICEWTIFEVKGYKVAWIWLTRMLRWIRRMWTLVKAWVLIKIQIIVIVIRGVEGKPEYGEQSGKSLPELGTMPSSPFGPDYL
ncbi:hypothetical protein Fcan01_23681 [Folsomia candida]|uniref:Uncharacterized protein n=1 Tax=Folsomia candida TaxID=158441 RepID=A0A226D7D3_FOLCA|nr:hypothetical protein Fcan01_23681 [Folsomia candida]